VARDSLLWNSVKKKPRHPAAARRSYRLMPLGDPHPTVESTASAAAPSGFARPARLIAGPSGNVENGAHVLLMC